MYKYRFFDLFLKFLSIKHVYIPISFINMVIAIINTKYNDLFYTQKYSRFYVIHEKRHFNGRFDTMHTPILSDIQDLNLSYIHYINTPFNQLISRQLHFLLICLPIQHVLEHHYLTCTYSHNTSNTFDIINYTYRLYLNNS
jgi:hypothetical protein